MVNAKLVGVRYRIINSAKTAFDEPSYFLIILNLLFSNDFLILQGEYDPLITKEKMDEELKGLAIKIVEIKNAGHMAHTENPSDTALLLIDFLTD